MSALSLHRGTAGAPTGSGVVATAAPTVVRAFGIEKRIDGRRILSEVSFELPSGTFVTLLGANGAGKSTLLRILAMLTAPTHGRLELFGLPASGDRPALRARVGMIGHQLMLYRDLSARENLEFFGRLYGVARGRADELLAFVGLADRASDQVKTLSRGMAQRVAIARALMHSPELLLADEPFTGLDAPSVALLERCLTGLHARGTSIVLANHDIRQSLRLAERVVVLHNGTVAADAPACVMDEPGVLRALGGQG